MTDTHRDNAKQQLKRLKHKAELCRYAHERMRSEACCRRCIMGIVIASLSLILSGLAVIFYRDIFPDYENLLLFIIGIIPPVLLFLQNIGSIYGWLEKESKYETAIYIWGQWIREADFLEKKMGQFSEEEIRKGISDVEEKYARCMEKTPTIPGRKFLCYKLNFREYRLMSEKIDNADKSKLVDIKQELKCSKYTKY